MPFVVLPCVLADLETCSSIQWEASASIPLWQIIFPNGGTRALRENIAYHMQHEFEDPNVHFYKVIDTSMPERLIACAKWIVTKGQSAPTHDHDHVPATTFTPPYVPSEDTNEPLFSQWTAEATPIREAYLKDRTIVLDDLSVRPEYQWQGAGKLLLKTFVGFADERVLPYYVESTPIAYNMYIHQGFREVDKVDMDLGQWKQGHGVYRITMLYRDPKRKSGEPDGKTYT
ncbi:MAG: hypothetical protein Q9213_008079 [Squamulea squamosa]